MTPAVANSLPTLEGILADDAFGVDPPAQPEVADGNPRPDLAAAVLAELRACNMGLACYLAHEGLRLSSLQKYRGGSSFDGFNERVEVTGGLGRTAAGGRRAC